MFAIGKMLMIFAVTAMAGFIQRVTGFGFGIFVMLFFPHMIEAHTASAAISTFVSCVISLYNAVIYREKIPYKKITPLIIAALITIPIAVRFSVIVSGPFFKRALGITLILLSIYFLFFNAKIKMKPSVKNGMLAGGIGGMLTGLFSTGGPPIVLYLINAFPDTMTYFASAQYYFGVTGIYSTLVRVLNGIITKEVIVYSVIGIIGSIIGNGIGKRVFSKLTSEKLRKLRYLGMIISGGIMVLQ